MKQNLVSQEILNSINTKDPAFFKNAFPKIFSWKKLEGLLNLRPMMIESRTKILCPKSYNWEEEEWLTEKNSFPPSVLKEELRNYIVYIGDVSHINPQINKICEEVEVYYKDYNLALDAHIYIDVSNKTSYGFGIHWDHVDVLIIQAEGKSNVRIWKDLIDPNVDVRNVSSVDDHPAIDEIMEPGDAVFIPRYHYHIAKSLTNRLSVSFPMIFNVNLKVQDRTWIKFDKNGNMK